MKNKYTWIVVGLVGLFVALPVLLQAANGNAVASLSYLGQSGLPRGMRNNNPGNIRISSSPWQGKVPVSQNTDGAFEQFEFYVYGIRAFIKNLLSYGSRGWANNITSIINHWAPSSDGNDTGAYIFFVANSTGIGPAETININDPATLRKIIIAMSEMENGRPAVTSEQFNAAYNLL